MEKIKGVGSVRRFRAAFTILLVACVGAYLLFNSHAATPLVGDLNNDGIVNVFDLSIFLVHWQATGTGIPEDFNSDGTVNIFDLSDLLTNYGSTTSSIPPQPADITGVRQDTTWAYNGSQWIAQIAEKSFGSATNFSNALLPDTAPLDSGTIDIGTSSSPNPVSINPSAANELQRQANAYGTYVNTSVFTAPITIVPADTPLTPVNCIYNGTNCISALRQTMLGISTTGTDLHGGLPIPDNFVPPSASDTDAEAIFYQPDYVSPCNSGIKGRMYEAWKLRANPSYDSTQPVSPSNPKWAASFGGRVVGSSNNSGHYGSWTASGCNFNQPGDPNSTYQLNSWGVLATGIFITDDEVSREDCTAGQIKHEIGVQVNSAKPGYRWPAQRGDGGTSSTPLLEGMRLRFPANMAKPTFNNRLESMLFDAAQKYGLVIDDKTSASLDIRVEPVVNGQAASECWALLDGQAGYNALSQFPWDKLQVLATGTDAAPNGP